MGTKRKSKYVKDDFDDEVRAEANEDREVREAKEEKERYSKEIKIYKEQKRIYDTDLERYNSRELETTPEKPEKPDPIKKKTDIDPQDLDKRENKFKLAQGMKGKHIRIADGRKLLDLLDLECKTNQYGEVEVICPRKFLESERKGQMKEMKQLSRLINPSIKSEPSSSYTNGSKNGIKKESPIKTEDDTSFKRRKISNDGKFESGGKGKGKQLDTSIKIDSDSDSDTIPCSNITSFSHRPIKKEDSDDDSEGDVPSNTSFQPFSQLQQKSFQIKQEVDSDDSEGDVPSNTSFQPSFMSKSHHPIKKENSFTSQFGTLSSNSSSGIFIKKESHSSRDQKMTGPDSSDDDGDLLTADPIDFNRFKTQIKREDEEMSSDNELPSNSTFILPKPSQIPKVEPIKEEKLPIEEEIPKPLELASEKIATVSASDRSPYEHRPSWPCTVAQKDAQPIALDSAHSIPAPVARFLRSYQVDGARFLFTNFMRGSGALLGDDMGTGKTVQTIAFFMAIMKQTGYAKDDEDRRSKECTLRKREGERKIDPQSVGHTALLIVPATVIQNWKNEIRTWSYLNAIEYGADNKDGLKKYKTGEFDILIVSHEYARDHIDELVSPSTNFSLLMIDEAHKFKNPSSTLTQSYHKFKENTVRFGLTGTAIQNDFNELWCLLDLLNPCSLGDGVRAWEILVADPIKNGMKSNSTLSERNNKAVVIDAVRTKILNQVYLRRTKEIIKDDLPQKFLDVLFCKMTPLQNEAYERALKDYNDNSLCECGAKWKFGGRKLFRHCHGLTNGEQHPEITAEDVQDAEKKHWFIYFHILTAIANHVGLLLPEKKPKDKMTPMDIARNAKRLQYLKMIFGGQNSAQMTNRLRENSAEYCGKWAALERLLARFHRDGDKVLLFSSRLASLQYVAHLAERKDYDHSILQGATPANQRQGLCDKFNNNPTKFLFLIATRAGGTGLNLTGANRVIIFDPSPNPAHDMQAIDRAFRLGQKRDVSVHRLISADSVETTMYERQVYKEQLSEGMLDGKVHTAFWEGKKGNDPTEYGSHLWGLKNLLQRPSSSTKTRTAQGHLEANLKEVDAYLDAPEIKFDDDEDEEEGLRSIIEAQAKGQDQNLAAIGVEDQQDHLDLMAGTEAVDIDTLKEEIIENWYSSTGNTESPFKKQKRSKAAQKSASPGPKEETKPKAGRKSNGSDKSSKASSSNNSGFKPPPRGGSWAPPTRTRGGTSSSTTSTKSTGVLAVRDAEQARKELSDLLKHQSMLRNRPDAKEFLEFIAQKEVITLEVLSAHLHKGNDAANKKLYAKYEKLFQETKELERNKSRPSGGMHAAQDADADDESD